MALQYLLTFRHDELRHLRWKETLQKTQPLQLRQLLGDAAFQRLVPLRELRRLGGYLIMQRLDAQH